MIVPRDGCGKHCHVDDQIIWRHSAVHLYPANRAGGTVSVIPITIECGVVEAFNSRSRVQLYFTHIGNSHSIKNPVTDIYIFHNSNFETYPSLTNKTQTSVRYLHLQWHTSIEFEKSRVDGDGRATDVDDTVLHVHSSLSQKTRERTRVTGWTHKAVSSAANWLLGAGAARTSPTDGSRGARNSDLAAATGGRGESQQPKEVVDKVGRGLLKNGRSVFQVIDVDEKILTE